MAMRNPAHPGRIVKAALDDLGLSVAEAAKGLGTSRYQLHRVIAGTSSVSPEMALRLERGIGSSAETWLRMQAAFDAAQIRDLAKDITVERLVGKTGSPSQPALV